jgi:peptidoglycan/LPS O-acetylase OafA/YrhL
MATNPHEAHAPTSGPRYQMLDVWRGLICLVVVLEHVGVILWDVGPEAHGWDGWFRRSIVTALRWNVGSPLFFVMSGYCIASSLDATRRRGDSPGRFLYRRLWRIYPTYWVALLAFVGFVAAADGLGLGLLHRNGQSLEIPSPEALNASQWLGNLTLTETWRPLVAGSRESSVFTRVAWSLCYQEQFYLICVLALWLAPARLERALALATAAILAFHLAAEDSGRLFYYDGTFLIYWHVFAVGLAVYWRLNRSAAEPAWARRGVEAGLAALAYLGYSGGSVPEAASATFGLVLIAMYRWDKAAGALAWLAPVRACGRRSYSIYLIHLPVTTAGNVLLTQLGVGAFWPRVFVALPLVTAASFAVGWAFHRAVESHFLGPPPVPGVRARRAAALAGPISIEAA